MNSSCNCARCTQFNAAEAELLRLAEFRAMNPIPEPWIHAWPDPLASPPIPSVAQANARRRNREGGIGVRNFRACG